MNRCTPRILQALFVLAASIVLLGCAQTHDATLSIRQFPASALRGELEVKAPPIIALDGKADRLSPGARIHSTSNLLVMTAPLIDQKLTVNYLRENTGLVHEVWILNSEEIKLKRPNSKNSWFSFGGSALETPPAVKAP